MSNKSIQSEFFVSSTLNDAIDVSANTEKDKNYEMVNHPKHYNQYDIEVIDMMRKIWGDEDTIIFCRLNAFKYRMRMGLKPNNSIDQDLQKEKIYLNYIDEIRREHLKI